MVLDTLDYSGLTFRQRVALYALFCTVSTPLIVGFLLALFPLLSALSGIALLVAYTLLLVVVALLVDVSAEVATLLYTRFFE